MTHLFRRVALSLLGIFACVLAVDVGLRVFSPFELHRDWEHPVIAAKERLYKKFIKRGVDVLIVGSSLSMNFDAKRLTKLSKKRVFNGSVAGLTAAGIGAVMKEAYTPLRKPRLVIYPLSMRDLRSLNYPLQNIPFLSHRMRAATAAKWQDKLEIAAERASYLFRVRRQIRHGLVTDDEEKRSFPLDEYGTRRHAPHSLRARLKNPKFAKQYFAKLETPPKAFSKTANAKELTKMIEANTRNGVQTVLVNMAISPAALQGQTRKHYKKYLAEVKALAKRLNVPFYDALGDLTLDNGHFNDMVHVGARGDRKVEDYLVPIIKRHL